MLRFLYAFFFGCFHTRTTFPMTVTMHSAHEGDARQRTYVACLDCGEELAYDWQKMKIEGRSRALPLSSATVIPIRRESPNLYRRLMQNEAPLTRAEAGR